jgi:hypothetical protein
MFVPGSFDAVGMGKAMIKGILACFRALMRRLAKFALLLATDSRTRVSTGN